MARIPEQEIERLKREVSVQRLAEARGVELKKHGAEDLVGLCVFHAEQSPSMVISNGKNLFHCFACGAAGSPIDWVMKLEGVSFRQAVELLRAGYPSGIAPSSSPSRVAPVKKSTVQKLPAPVEPDADDQKLLRQVLDYYHQTLQQSPEALKYLADRGLTGSEMIERFHLGFANRTLCYRLPAKNRAAGAEIRGRLQKLGILRESGHESYNGSVVFPIFGEQGEVLGLYGRKITPNLRKGTPLHLYLPGPHRGVWNIEALAASREIILCEALIDAMTFWCAGFRNVTASYGASGFTEEHMEAFKRYGTRRVLIAYDRDEAGERGAAAVAERLMGEGIECFRIQFPKGMDANEYALKVQPAPKSLGLVVRKALWLGKGAAPADSGELGGSYQSGIESRSDEIRAEAGKMPAAQERAAGSSKPERQTRSGTAGSHTETKAERQHARTKAEAKAQRHAQAAEKLPRKPEPTGQAEHQIIEPAATDWQETAPAAGTELEPGDANGRLSERAQPSEIREATSFLAAGAAASESTADPIPLALQPAWLDDADAATEPLADAWKQAETAAAQPLREPGERLAQEPARSPRERAAISGADVSREPAESAAAPKPAAAPLTSAKGQSIAAYAPADLPASPEPPAPASGAVLEMKGEQAELRLGDRFWRIRGLAKNTSFEQLRVNVLCAREGTFHVDTLDLYSARQRAAYIKQAAAELGAEEEVIKRDLGRVLLGLEELHEKQLRDAMAPKPVAVLLSDQERDAALELLRDPRLLDRILADFERCGVVGEESNKLIGYLSAVSRKLEEPLAIIIQSSSAAGKTSLMEAILSFIPEEDRIKFSAMTGQSLFYMGDRDLEHKILAIVEEEGAQRASYALKLLQSEGELSIASTGKDPNTGRLITQEYRVHGPVMILLTTTAIEIDEELQNRCIVVSVNEDREQTRAIHRLQRERETLEGLWAREDKKRLLKLHQDAQRLLRSLQVVNPYARELTFLDDQTRTRRDHMKYLTLIRAVALLHQYQRTARASDRYGEHKQYIEVEPRDIDLANRLAAEAFGRSLDELPQQTRRLLGLVNEMVTAECARLSMERSDFRFSRRAVRQFTAWSDFQVKVHMKKLEELEYVLVHRGGRGQSFVYELLYAGEGQDGRRFLMGLLEPAKLGGHAYDEKLEHPAGQLEGGGRVQVAEKEPSSRSVGDPGNGDGTGAQAQFREEGQKSAYLDATKDSSSYPRRRKRGAAPQEAA
jgi:DNA primase catalytic core